MNLFKEWKSFSFFQKGWLWPVLCNESLHRIGPLLWARACANVCVCVHNHACVCLCSQSRARVCVFVFTITRACVCVFVFTITRACERVCVHNHASVCACVCILNHQHVHKRTKRNPTLKEKRIKMKSTEHSHTCVILIFTLKQVKSHIL